MRWKHRPEKTYLTSLAILRSAPWPGVEFETLDLRCTIEQNGQEFTMNQTMLVCKKGNWLYQMVISYFEDDALETFLACFSAV